MKVTVCDDDDSVREQISWLIGSQNKQDSVKSFRSIFALVTYLYDDARGDIDLLIINTRVGNEDGISAAGNIKDFYPQINIIFISDRYEDATRIFDVNPIYFLGLPLQNDYAEKAFAKARDKCRERANGALTLKAKGNIFKLDFSSIVFLESQGRKAVVHTLDSQWESNMTMDKLIELLPHEFWQCHRSYIINTGMLQGYKNGEIILFGNIRIPLARGRMDEFRKILDNVQANGD